MSSSEQSEPEPATQLADGTWPLTAVRELRAVFTPSLAVPQQARHAARELLAESIAPTELQDVLLILTELVTNAVRHAAAAVHPVVEVHLAVSPERVRGEIRDSGTGFRPGHDARDPLDGSGGFGLIIVDRAASRWGASGQRPHCVWFELDRHMAP